MMKNKMNKYYSFSIFTSFLNTIGSIIITVIFTYMMIQLMGVDKYGSWSALFIIYGVASLTDLGVSKLIVLNKNKNLFSSIYSSVLTVVLFTTIFIVILYVAYVLFSLTLDRIAITLSIGVVILISMSLLSIIKSVLESVGLISIVNIISLLQTFSVYLASYCGFFVSKDIYVAGLFSAISTALLTLLSYMVAKKNIKGMYCYVSLRDSLKITASGLHLTSASIIYTLYQPVFRYFILMVAGTSWATFLDVIMKIGNAVTSGINVFINPLLYKLVQLDNGVEKVEYVNKAVIRLIILLLVGLITYLLLHEVVFSFFATNFSKFNMPILIIIVGFGLKGCAEPIVRYFWVENLLHIYNAISLSILMTSTVCFFILFVYKEVMSYYLLAMCYAIPIFISGVLFLIKYKINLLSIEK